MAGRRKQAKKTPQSTPQKTPQPTPQKTPQPTPQKTPQQTHQNTPQHNPKNDQNSPRKDRPPTLSAVSNSIKELDNILKPLLDEATEHPELNNEHLTAALKFLTEAIKDVSRHLYNENTKNKETEVRMREHDDEMDAQKQMNLRGKFVITSPPGGEALVKSVESFKDDKVKVLDHVIDLAERKYKVKIPKEDISTCYHLKKGGIVLGLWNLGRGSAFHRILTNIKSNKEVDKELNVYFNYMLTRKRNSLLYAVRQLKKEKKISKFFNDEHGNISVESNKGEKDRVTYIFDKSAKVMRTLSIEELQQKYQ